MHELTQEGRRIVEDLARRHGFSTDAVLVLLQAVSAGHGTQAQFNHPEFGGMGQWSQGGMIMIGDMFNNALKARVDALCTELAGILRGTSMFAPAPAPFQSQSQSQGGVTGVSLFVPGSAPGQWWPPELGSPASVGAQNNLRYAYFPAARRLAIELGGRVTVYDTADHQIGGFSQQQSGDQSLTFTSQYGLVRVADLTVVQAPGARPEPAPAAPPPEPAPTRAPEPAATAPGAEPAPAPPSDSGAAPADDIFLKIERLAELRQKGILTEQEFETKKAELLRRL
ncbi:MAG TPA: SHOCT domain-containing protein [Paracoccaceae bacterium]|nr:SHOCT domain-containing protein [Paracoccaceae bacterium]